MKSRIVISVVVLAVIAAGLVSVPSPARALNHLNCSYCHTMHTPTGPNLTVATTFDLVCESCHAVGTSAAPDALTHVYPAGSASPYWNFGCHSCHSQHSSLGNRFYNNGATHPHNVGSIQGTGNGVNIKLMGRDEDGSGIAKVQTPLAMLSAAYNNVTPPTPCTTGNTAVRVKLPPFSQGLGRPHTIMVGDRITVVNTNPATFNGTFRVKQTFKGTSRDWVCYDSPSNPGTYGTTDLQGRTTSATLTNGWLFSAGWHNRARVSSAVWSTGTATLNIRGSSHSIQVSENITVSGINPLGFNGTYAVTSVTASTVSYAVANPGAYVSGGWVEYKASAKSITAASHVSGEITFTSGSDVSTIQPASQTTVTTPTSAARSGGQWYATITVAQNIGVQVGDGIVVSGVNPAGYNGTYKVTGVAGLTITYGTLPGNPGTYVSGGAANGLDGDIIMVFGVVSTGPGTFNGKWEVKAVNTGAKTITVRCPPPHRSNLLPNQLCSLNAAGGGYVDPGTYVSGGSIQSTGTMRPVVFESRGEGFSGTTMHSFADVDLDTDGVMDGPCELCHINVVINHINDDFTDAHNPGKSCSLSCHPHGIGFDKGTFSGDSPLP